MVRALALLFGLTTAAVAPAQTIVTPVDPLAIGTDDFTRLAFPALWDGLTVVRIEFRVLAGLSDRQSAQAGGTALVRAT